MQDMKIFEGGQGISVGQFADLIREIQTDRLLGLAETAAQLEVEPGDVLGWVDEGLIAAELVDGRLVFRLVDVLQWRAQGLLRSKSQHPGPEIL